MNPISHLACPSHPDAGCRGVCDWHRRATRRKASPTPSKKPTPTATTADTTKPVTSAATPAGAASDAIKKEASMGTAAADSTRGRRRGRNRRLGSEGWRYRNQNPPAATRTPEKKPETPVDPAAPYKDVKFAAGEKPHVIMETSMGKIVHRTLARRRP